jgi:hypothetical protein
VDPNHALAMTALAAPAAALPYLRLWRFLSMLGMAVSVDGGFTLDELRAHSMPLSYAPGLAKLIPQAAVPITAPAFALANGQMLIGREL